MESVAIGSGIIYQGHVLDILPALPSDSVDCVVTSPPYWGLRDYKIEPQIWDENHGPCEHEWGEEATVSRSGGTESSTLGPESGGHAMSDESRLLSTTRSFVQSSQGSFCLRCGAWRGSLGLEPTPELFVKHIVQVFREVRRVLRKDGTLWLNFGDSYTSGNRTHRRDPDSKNIPAIQNFERIETPPGLKPKDLIGIPWRVAFALQQPYYTGRIKEEKDRLWLAGLFDGEGCFGIRKQQCSGNRNQTYNDSYIPFSSVKMSDRQALDRAVNLTGLGSVRAEAWKVGEDSRKVKTVRVPYTWRLDGNKAVQLARELYPHLLIKQNQAACICTLDDSNKDKRRGKGHAVPQDVIKERDEIWMTIKALNQRKIENLPKFIHAPESLYEPGWWLRSDIIWSKPNPMPESVTDRPTKSHEYIFMLTKSAKYFWNAEAVREPGPTITRHGTRPLGGVIGEGRNDRENFARDITYPTRNIRSVWTFATEPTPEAHFATFPQELVKRCIMAGTSEKGCCPKCGKLWVPVVEKQKYGRWDYGEGNNSDPTKVHRKRSDTMGKSFYDDWKPGELTGWRPSCSCGEERTVPAVCLDPFFGSGTTGIVSENLYRKWIGIELNPEYIKIAEKRLEVKANVNQGNWLKNGEHHDRKANP